MSFFDKLVQLFYHISSNCQVFRKKYFFALIILLKVCENC